MTKTLVLQRGHYPRTTGKTGGPGEQAMAVRVGDAVKKLTPPGWQVRIINADEPTDKYAGDAFVAVHGDAADSRKSGGASYGYRTSASGALGARWKAAYGKVWPFGWRSPNYTVNLSSYYGTGRAKAAGTDPAIVIEVGFMSNPQERAWIDANATAIAASIWRAVAGTTGTANPVQHVRPYRAFTVRDVKLRRRPWDLRVTARVIANVNGRVSAVWGPWRYFETSAGRGWTHYRNLDS